MEDGGAPPFPICAGLGRDARLLSSSLELIPAFTASPAPVPAAIGSLLRSVVLRCAAP
ncbi:hypothetical protein ACP70R_047706 [Stipagrostis hirtigluma subsp. patula]